MRFVHCAGCGKKEREDLPEPTIGPVKIVVGDDSSVRHWEQQFIVTHAEDLCQSCTNGILRMYFHVDVPGVLEPPVSIRAVS